MGYKAAHGTATHIERASEFVWRVESDSDSHKKYIVDLSPDDPDSCTCVAFAIKRNRTGVGTCKHIERVLSLEGVERLAQHQAERDEAEAALVTADLFEILKELR